MSKAKRLREMQDEITGLKLQLERANERIAEYQKKDKGTIGDFLKPQSGGGKKLSLRKKVCKENEKIRAEMLKEVEKFEKRLKPFDNDICPFTKFDVEFCEKNVSCLKCVLTKLKSKIQQTERFRTQSGAGGK